MPHFSVLADDDVTTYWVLARSPEVAVRLVTFNVEGFVASPDNPVMRDLTQTPPHGVIQSSEGKTFTVKSN